MEDLKNEINILSKKLQRVSLIMTSLLKKRRNDPQPCNRYYSVLKMYNTIRDNITNLQNQLLLSKLNKKENILNKFEEKRAIKEANVTSLTYDRARKKTSRDFDKFFFKNR